MKLTVNEMDYMDRSSGENVILQSSELFSKLKSMILSIDESMKEINLTLMELETAYEEGAVTRTVMNGFNNELDKSLSKAMDLHKNMYKIVDYSRTHTDSETYDRLKKDSDWFRDRR